MTHIIFSQTARAIFWIMGTNICFTSAMALSKTLSAEVSNLVLLAVRYFFGSLLLASIVTVQKQQKVSEIFNTQKPLWQMLRVGLVLLATGLTYFAYRNLSLPIATSVGFSGPLFTSIFAVIFLSEKLNREKIISLILGYIGVIIIVRPDASSGIVLLAFLAALGANASAALAIVSAKFLTRSDSPFTIQSYSTFATFFVALILSLFVWKTPGVADILCLAGMGVLGTLGQLFYLRAIKLVDASFVSPFEYVRLLLALPIGYFFFNETIDFVACFGVLFIIIGTYRLIKNG